MEAQGGEYKFSNEATFALLLILQIMKRQFRFLVFHDGRLYFLEISQFCLTTTIDIIQQFPDLQGLSNGALEEILVCLKASFIKLSFKIGDQLLFVDWKDVVFQGEPGKQRTLKVSLPNGKEAFAKYTGNCGDLFIVEEIVTKQLFEIPLRNILDHNKPSSEVLERYKLDLTSQSERELMLKEKKAQAPCLQFPMALPRKNTNNVLYPFLEHGDLLVLFFLCKKIGLQLGNNYPFNNLLIRFQACGSQEKFFHEVPQLTESENKAFKVFERTYMDNFMGNVMESGVQRCSKLTVQEVFLAQFEVAKHFKILSQCALNLPFEYFTNSEPEVVLRKGDEALVPHSSLKKLE